MRLQRYRNAIIALAAALSVLAVLCVLKLRSGAEAAASAGKFPTATQSPSQTAEPTALPTALPTAQATPAATPQADYALAVQSAFGNELAFETGLQFNRSNAFADEIGANKEALLSLGDRLFTQAQAALDRAAETAAVVCDTRPIPCTLTGGVPDWQLAAALMWAMGEQRGMEALASGCSVDCMIRGGALTAELKTADIYSLLDGASPDERFTADFVYSYYRTVYEPDFTFTDYKMPELSPDYVATLGLPLKQMIYHDSWYDPRQQSTRYHLGMDIHSAPDTPILSCTDGTVTALGFDNTAGYYVVVTDDFGYEYHYYHMIRKTDHIAVGDTVFRGQTIGNVGCTGNSDAYHLHLSIITPEHVHLNPYYVMRAVRNAG